MNEAIEADKATTAKQLQKFLAMIPDDWKPAIRFVGRVIGPAWDTVQGTLVVRMVRYAKNGFTLADVRAACRHLDRPDVQVKCEWPNDWLREFAAAIFAARQAREAQEARDRHAAKFIVSAEEKAKSDALWAAYRKRNNLPPRPAAGAAEELLADAFTVPAE